MLSSYRQEENKFINDVIIKCIFTADERATVS